MKTSSIKSKVCFIFCLWCMSLTGFTKNQSLLIETNNPELVSPTMEDFGTEAEQLQKVFDTYFKDKNLTLRVQFIDPSPYPDYIQWLVDWWAETYPEEDPPQDIEILFSKVDESEVWMYEGLKIENRELKEKHLLPKVMNYVEAYILQEGDDEKQIIRKWLLALAKVLNKSWLQALQSQSENYALRKEYDRSYAGFDMNYYEFFPFEKGNILYEYMEDSILEATFEDSVLSAHYILMDHENTPAVIKDNQLLKPDFDKTDKNQRSRYESLMAIVEILKKHQYFHESKKVSDWPNTSTKGWMLSRTQPNGFVTKTDTMHKLLMVRQPTLKKSSFMPNMAWRQNYGEWKATRCNLFACDFSKAYLPDKTIPWGSQWLRAHEIYGILPDKPEFLSLNWNEAWDYINAGFPVYFVSPKKGPAGHIAIGYPSEKLETEKKAKDNGYIVQAGSSCGKKLIRSGFGDEVVDQKEEDKKIKIYLYIGYLSI